MSQRVGLFQVMSRQQNSLAPVRPRLHGSAARARAAPRYPGQPLVHIQKGRDQGSPHMRKLQTKPGCFCPPLKLAAMKRFSRPSSCAMRTTSSAAREPWIVAAKQIDMISNPKRLRQPRHLQHRPQRAFASARCARVIASTCVAPRCRGDQPQQQTHCSGLCPRRSAPAARPTFARPQRRGSGCPAP